MSTPARAPSRVAHKQTGYTAAPVLEAREPLPLPALTSDLEQARSDLRERGLCLLTGALLPDEVEALRDALQAQADAERALGALAPPLAGPEGGRRQQLSNLVNKGAEFLQLVERPEVDALAGYLLGRDFLLSSLTGGLYHAPSTEPQVLHRDQGQVPATVDFPAICNLFWLLDDFTPERGSTCIVPGSHRWKPEHQVKPPPRELAVQIEAPAGSVFAWDGRLWHGAGVNREGHPRRHLATFFCLPWMRQQENWGISCLQEVLDEASPQLKVRLGLKTYGTLGMVSGAVRQRDPSIRPSLGNYPVQIPDYVIGEHGALHPLRRVSRKLTAKP